MSAKRFKTGDKVFITYRERTVAGVVVLASANGRSLFLAFQAMLGGYVGQMPVLQVDASNDFEDLIMRERVVVKAAGPS